MSDAESGWFTVAVEISVDNMIDISNADSHVILPRSLRLP
jgi:hypothetical protein